MNRVSEILAERINVSLDEFDGPDVLEELLDQPAPVVEDLIEALRGLAAAISGGGDLDPPSVLRHLHTVDQTIRLLRQK